MSTPSKRRSAGYNAFDPNTDPDDLNPWAGRTGWLAESYASDFNEGWYSAKSDYEKGKEYENECKCTCGGCCTCGQ